MSQVLCSYLKCAQRGFKQSWCVGLLLCVPFKGELQAEEGKLVINGKPEAVFQE